MALLHYKNLGVHRPDVLMRMSVSGLKIFYDFLTLTKRHMESDAAVMRIAWSPVRGADDQDEEISDGSWIRLDEPEGRLNVPEAAFRFFLDESVRDIYEWKPADGDADHGRHKRGRIDFSKLGRIRVLDRRPKNRELLLERTPNEGFQLVIRPNTWSIECQRRALRALQNNPQREHLPLLRLFERLDHAQWGKVVPEIIREEDWAVLTDVDRPGTGEQRRFVSAALGTPDFTFLEGPPGSGKTTAICELIMQLAKRDMRVLLCASTHVAVDNVLERLMDDDQNLVIPVRIGDRRNVSEKARPWQIEEFVKTERERILRELDHVRPLTASQAALDELLRQGSSAIERMALDAANLVCGTTIGILQHPDLRERSCKRRGGDPEFDVLIVDEASKTPFQEFLVPALWAQRWVVVGDPMQLSPYVDDDALAVNIETCLPDAHVREACIDAFLAANRRRPRVAAVAVNSEKTKRAYMAQCSELDVAVADADRSENTDLWAADIVMGGSDSLQRRAAELPLDIVTVRCADGDLSLLQRRAVAWRLRSGLSREGQPDWAAEVGWRLASLYAQRFAEYEEHANDRGGRTTAQRLEAEIGKLLPVPKIVDDQDRVWRDIDRVRRVALPSVLESLQDGFESDDDRPGTALSDGLPEDVLEERHVMLSTQHRMHPDIAKFSHEHIYDGEALRTPGYMKEERNWSYSRYRHRAEWIHVPGSGVSGDNRNEREASRIIDELRHFDKWAKTNHRDGISPREVAVLTFYRGQEREIRSHLQRWTGQRSALRHFHRGPSERPYLTVELCTVDRFQGHEADFVLISFANRRPTSFLESPNRLNVALTRARYQRVVVGDRHAMKRARAGALREFVEGEPWGMDTGTAES